MGFGKSDEYGSRASFPRKLPKKDCSADIFSLHKRDCRDMEIKRFSEIWVWGKTAVMTMIARELVTFKALGVMAQVFRAFRQRVSNREKRFKRRPMGP